MGTGGNECVALERGVLEHACLIFHRSPPLRGELADLSGSLWDPSYKAALAIDDADMPVPRDLTLTEEGKKSPCSHDHGQPTKWVTVLEDWDFDSDDPILRDGTIQEIGDDN